MYKSKKRMDNYHKRRADILTDYFIKIKSEKKSFLYDLPELEQIEKLHIPK
jgi:hypothetical protein